MKQAEATILDRLLDTPAARAAADAEAKKTAKLRAELAARREEIERQAEARYHEFYDVTLPKCLAAAAAAQEKLKAAKAAHALVISKKAEADNAANYELLSIEAQLEETANPAIDAFVEDLRNLLDATLKMPIPEATITVHNVVTGKKTVVAGRQLVSPAHRSQAIREAIAAAKALKLVADQTGVPARLQDLRAALPTVGAEINPSDKKD